MVKWCMGSTLRNGYFVVVKCMHRFQSVVFALIIKTAIVNGKMVHGFYSPKRIFRSC